MALMGVYAVFGFSYNVLMSVIANIVLKQDVAGYGMMMGATGAGACVGALFPRHHRGSYSQRTRAALRRIINFRLAHRFQLQP